MAYPLQSMLKIRAMREERASTELTVARKARLLAEKERAQKQAELDSYNATKEERRSRVYDAVIGRVVKMDALDAVRDAVAVIDEEGVLLANAEKEARVVLEKRNSEAESARVKYVAASKNKMKIEEHKVVWEDEARKEQEHAQDAEMEEFTGKKQELEE